MNTPLVANALTAVLGVLAVLGFKFGITAEQVTAAVGALATLAAIGNQVVHYFRDRSPS